MNRDGCDDDDSRALYPGVMSGVGPYMSYIIMFSVCCCSPVRLTAGFGQVNFFLVFSFFIFLFDFFFIIIIFFFYFFIF